jgi:hypothetical protein
MIGSTTRAEDSQEEVEAIAAHKTPMLTEPLPRKMRALI